MVNELYVGDKNYIGVFNVFDKPIPDCYLNPLITRNRLKEIFGVTDVIFSEPVDLGYRPIQIPKISQFDETRLVGVYIEESELEKIKTSGMLLLTHNSPKIFLG